MASSEKMDDASEEIRRRRKHGMLKLYYGMEDTSKENQDSNPIDINGAQFDPQVYLSRLMKEKRLNELIDRESDMVKQIRSLDSDMQTLVYENYNKFISATDTIRKMKNDFKKMEDEMDRLATNMDAITEFSAGISNTLQERRQQISKLSGVHSLLKKLQFLFELPARLKKCIEMKAYGQAVRYYAKTRAVLNQYQHMPSFHGIQQDCSEIVAELRSKLREQFRDKESTPKQLAECVDLLLQLKEPADELCDEFLARAQEKLDEDLSEMSAQVNPTSVLEVSTPEDEMVESSEKTDERPSEKYMRNMPMDILEFIHKGCTSFLGNICLVIASYKELFVNRQTHSDPQEQEQLQEIAHSKLAEFVKSRMEQYFSCVELRIQAEKESVENSMLVRALDRFHRRLQAVDKLLPELNIIVRGTEIVANAARERSLFYLEGLKNHFIECTTDVRQKLCTPRLIGKQETSNLMDMLTMMSSSIVEQMKVVLANLQGFTSSDLTFANTAYFQGTFCVHDVREVVVVGFLKYLFKASCDLCERSGEKGSAPAAIILLLSRLHMDFSNTTISQIVTTADNQFSLDPRCKVTPAADLATKAKKTAQKLLNQYVQIQGLQISQMLRKSVETRDWLNTIEPRNVRAVMKRVVEDVTAIDTQVGHLYEEGVRKAHSSDSSRRLSLSSARHHKKEMPRNYTPSTNFDNSLMTNIQKLFSERIEIFSAVEFSKVSVLTGIIKISLKTLLECVRLRTFGRYGLQQMQVDTHYLDMYIWRFVSDENLVHFLLDEIVGSTIHRCLDPILMEPSVIEVICERG
ncbi:vacuolar protein sorting-associated protein 51 homolog [Anneissia japonica]|uniref:vacuolar protein sorting-associated protein 51 homolog n=1 Tax=Anneissia japonica TaxID=1529436 RepID=UPI0014258304|nr:vacuolar protein sorting-associated protein 51 homolog [Anneissia japonica]